MVTHQLQVKRRTGKVRRPETDVLPLSHATNQDTVQLVISVTWLHRHCSCNKNRFQGMSSTGLEMHQSRLRACQTKRKAPLGELTLLPQTPQSTHLLDTSGLYGPRCLVLQTPTPTMNPSYVPYGVRRTTVINLRQFSIVASKFV